MAKSLTDLYKEATEEAQAAKNGKNFFLSSQDYL